MSVTNIVVTQIFTAASRSPKSPYFLAISRQSVGHVPVVHVIAYKSIFGWKREPMSCVNNEVELCEQGSGAV